MDALQFLTHLVEDPAELVPDVGDHLEHGVLGLVVESQISIRQGL